MNSNNKIGSRYKIFSIRKMRKGGGENSYDNQQSSEINQRIERRITRQMEQKYQIGEENQRDGGCWGRCEKWTPDSPNLLVLLSLHSPRSLSLLLASPSCFLLTISKQNRHSNSQCTRKIFQLLTKSEEQEPAISKFTRRSERRKAWDSRERERERESSGCIPLKQRIYQSQQQYDHQTGRVSPLRTILKPETWSKMKLWSGPTMGLIGSNRRQWTGRGKDPPNKALSISFSPLSVVSISSCAPAGSLDSSWAECSMLYDASINSFMMINFSLTYYHNYELKSFRFVMGVWSLKIFSTTMMPSFWRCTPNPNPSGSGPLYLYFLDTNQK